MVEPSTKPKFPVLASARFRTSGEHTPGGERAPHEETWTIDPSADTAQPGIRKRDGQKAGPPANLTARCIARPGDSYPNATTTYPKPNILNRRRIE